MASKMIFVLAALLAVSGLAAGSFGMDKTSLENIINGKYDVLVEIVEQVLLGINKLFSEVYHEMAYGMRSMLSALEEFRDVGIQVGEQIIVSELALLNAVIQVYKNETNPDSETTWQCIQKTEDEYIEVQDQAINSSSFCINSAIQTIGDNVMQILVDFKTMNENLKKEETTMETCKNETSPVDCMKGVLGNLWNIVETLTTTINADADKAQADFDNIETTIGICNSETQAFVEKENKRMFNDFLQCVSGGEQTTISS